MNTELLKNDVLRTLLYYDIFSYPLKAEELYTFMPSNSISKQHFTEIIENLALDENNLFGLSEEYFYVKPNINFINIRREKEKISRKMWRAVGVMTHIIKRFPYVRCILVTGSLSKNNSDNTSDLDFMIITEKNRLWLSRMLLTLFKKIFLFNSYKYFCLNYYITSDKLEIEEKNIFTATEIAYVKASYNTGLMEDFLRANTWVKDFFPNYVICDPNLNTPGCKAHNKASIVQKFLEFFFNGKTGDKLNEHFRQTTINYWYKRYAHIDKKEHSHMFKSTESVSKAHPLNMQKKILNRYYDKLKEFNL